MVLNVEQCWGSMGKNVVMAERIDEYSGKSLVIVLCVLEDFGEKRVFDPLFLSLPFWTMFFVKLCATPHANDWRDYIYRDKLGLLMSQ